MFPTACTSPDLENRRLFPTLVRCATNNNKLGDAVRVIISQYGWTQIAMLTEDAEVCNYGAEGIKNQMKVMGYYMFLTDATYLYLTILDELLSERKNYSDGQLFQKKARNRDFYGLTGHVILDNNADRSPDYWLWHCPPDEQQCQPFALLAFSLRSMASCPSFASGQTNEALFNRNQLMKTKIGTYNGSLVAVKYIDKPSINLTRKQLVELNTDILENDDINLDWMFKTSLLTDLINGMVFIGKTSFHSHGSLKSANCLIDSRWVLKISDFGLVKFKEGEKDNEEESDFKRHEKLLWTAPELLRLSEAERPLNGTPKDILEKVRNTEEVPYRPEPPDGYGSAGAPPDVIQLMHKCWDEEPISRPSFDEIRKIFKSINKGRRTNIMDNIISMLEKYASNLESLVQQRTGELMEEKKKTDILLYRMLPTIVAEKLKKGQSVEPEMYDAVTIYFSDIVGFTNLSSLSTPMQVVDLLNDLYTTFDRTIQKYDVYKVETIGDAYMTVSGLPVRNGNRHVVEIADMATALLDEVLTFRIRHMPDRILHLRIGLHTGPCAAGIVGQTMPRYCLFGDTVNMASRMESTGEGTLAHNIIKG
ncbi:hypothetical protein LSH36_433g00068 [Paralvinella palmiformis]|uniref:Guanylate cyclase domain-containing protein n=1 Tax=Paralvinella palmiformis TaxID=53620 RepID=A0AAD9JB80_9ANNE|nr:hypothetical protein LSH36_433g00068 [Paralvinella palmiformis]